MLSSHTNILYDVYLRVEYLIPLRVGHHILSERIEVKLLVVHRFERILFLRLPQESIFNQTVQGQRVTGSAYHVPLCVLLHFILQKLCALSKN